MLKREVTIINQLGLHARASAKFTQTASSFQSDIWVSRRGKRINGKSIMGLLMLAASQGAVIEIEISGEDENEAMEALVALINDYFGEGA
ncbi:MAG: HPr family phosphocarrier protein [Neisseriaceae bacterium]|nr:HPr family phosphocarrier protein [Neisseriaceae bacterium]MBQ9619847.1 HPr family phosphocarrier protein [Neisseriaceae bacterium]